MTWEIHQAYLWYPFLLKKGAKVNYFDPTGEKKNFKNLKNIKFSNNVNSAIKNSDLIIIHTEWNDFKSINFKKKVENKKFMQYLIWEIFIHHTKMKELEYQLLSELDVNLIQRSHRLLQKHLDGKLLVLTAALVCIPASPKIETIKSDAPLITLGWSIKSSVEFTNPVNFTHDLILDKSLLQAFFTCEIILKPHLFAAS